MVLFGRAGIAFPGRLSLSQLTMISYKAIWWGFKVSAETSQFCFSILGIMEMMEIELIWFPIEYKIMDRKLDWEAFGALWILWKMPGHHANEWYYNIWFTQIGFDGRILLKLDCQRQGAVVSAGRRSRFCQGWFLANPNQSSLAHNKQPGKAV